VTATPTLENPGTLIRTLTSPELVADVGEDEGWVEMKVKKNSCEEEL
jgi:hypothetical protein